MNNVSSPENQNRQNPLQQIEDIMEGRRAKKPEKFEKPGLDLSSIAERVQGIINDFVDRVRKTTPTAPPSVTPR